MRMPEYTKSDATLNKERRDLVVALLNLKYDAMRLGLIKTHHALDDATGIVGWEIAEDESQ